MHRADKRLFDMCNNYMYNVYGCVDWDMFTYCHINKHYSYDCEDQKYISVRDLQDACDDLGIDIDCLNF